ncbi:hypothetical protein AYI70_g5922 [Smittium culicis]|uniref:Uncharacterized protein n=1 Tax=Smittium culicis TaxID=133412 RepID=A0A1R1XS87_9FUNG|nr:hypothetical protein AYI70_g5922 [Smittium culicis]
MPPWISLKLTDGLGTLKLAITVIEHISTESNKFFPRTTLHIDVNVIILKFIGFTRKLSSSVKNLSKYPCILWYGKEVAVESQILISFLLYSFLGTKEGLFDYQDILGLCADFSFAEYHMAHQMEVFRTKFLSKGAEDCSLND